MRNLDFGKHSCTVLSFFISLALPPSPRAEAQSLHQTNNLVCASREKYQGSSVALSADGNTVFVGCPGHIGLGQGGACVFIRSAGKWTQQGKPLVGTGGGNPFGAPGGNPEVGVNQGWSVALSGDGNTALVGGPFDWSSGATGAVWVWTRKAGVWTQQGSKLVGSGAVGSHQGLSVALSADGNTALVGGAEDDEGVGAAWIWTRSGAVWTQQGSKVVGSGAVGKSNQGSSVA